MGLQTQLSFMQGSVQEFEVFLSQINSSKYIIGAFGLFISFRICVRSFTLLSSSSGLFSFRILLISLFQLEGFFPVLENVYYAAAADLRGSN